MDVLLGILVAVTVVIHLVCAISVAIDAGKLVAGDQGLWPFGRGLWIVATLLGGLVAASCYWLIHMSRVTRVDRLALEPEPPPKPVTTADDAALNPELQRIQQRMAEKRAQHDD